MTYQILHFIDTLGAGGAERQLVYLLENLKHSRYQSSVLTTYDQFRHYEPILHSMNIPLYSLHHGDLTVPNRVYALQRYIRVMWKLKPDIVHCWLHYPNLIAGAAKFGCPPHKLIASVREELSPRAQRLEQYLEPAIDFRIVNEKYNSKQKSAKQKPSRAIPNGIDTNVFSKTTPRINTTGTTNILIPARIDPRKDHATLLNAITKIPTQLQKSLQITLIGQVTHIPTQRQIEQSIKKQNLAQIISQLSPTDNITPHYHTCDYVILPSRSEMFPNVVLEAFAASKPVIASAAANRMNIITHDVNGWIFPTGDSQALAELIQKAMNTSGAVREKMGQSAFKVAGKFPISQTIEAYQSIYDQLISDI